MRLSLLLLLFFSLTAVAKHHVIGFEPHSANIQPAEIPTIEQLAYDFASRKNRALFVVEGCAHVDESTEIWYDRAAEVANVAQYYGVPHNRIKIIESPRHCRHAVRIAFLKDPDYNLASRQASPAYLL